jgi:hypothetical protein
MVINVFWERCSQAKIIDIVEGKYRLQRLIPAAYCSNYDEFTQAELVQMIQEYDRRKYEQS